MRARRNDGINKAVVEKIPRPVERNASRAGGDFSFPVARHPSMVGIWFFHNSHNAL
jgi:hypothetical protein